MSERQRDGKAQRRESALPPTSVRGVARLPTGLVTAPHAWHLVGHPWNAEGVNPTGTGLCPLPLRRRCAPSSVPVLVVVALVLGVPVLGRAGSRGDRRAALPRGRNLLRVHDQHARAGGALLTWSSDIPSKVRTCRGDADADGNPGCSQPQPLVRQLQEVWPGTTPPDGMAPIRQQREARARVAGAGEGASSRPLRVSRSGA